MKSQHKLSTIAQLSNGEFRYKQMDIIVTESACVDASWPLTKFNGLTWFGRAMWSKWGCSFSTRWTWATCKTSQANWCLETSFDCSHANWARKRCFELSLHREYQPIHFWVLCASHTLLNLRRRGQMTRELKERIFKFSKWLSQLKRLNVLI